MTPFNSVTYCPPKGQSVLNPAILLMEQLFKHTVLVIGVPMIEFLTTKLFISSPRRNLVSRPRLVYCPGIKQDNYLAVITALAAFGKTVSLSDLISQSSYRIASLSSIDVTGTPGVASCKLT